MAIIILEVLCYVIYVQMFMLGLVLYMNTLKIIDSEMDKVVYDMCNL